MGNEGDAQGATGEPTRAEQIEEAKSLFVVDWSREPTALYVNAAALDFAPDVVSLVFLDALPAPRRRISGTPQITVNPAASLRMTNQNFFYFMMEMLNRWNERAKFEAERGGEPRPTVEFKVIQPEQK
jgi:hypothetical protein